MSTGTEQVKPGVSFACPACKGELEHSIDEYTCISCAGQYPVLFGIADFRLRSDRYLTIEQEREKAKRLYEFALTTSFEQLIDYYYSITDDVPPELAVRYKAYINNAPDQARGVIARLDPDPDNDTLLDLGCGTGGLLVAASGHFRQMVGVDIALRWLVICKKRLDELGINATLVCADAEQLPFKCGQYSHVVAADLVEHVHDSAATIKQCYKQLKNGGRYWISATNRYCIGPYPLTRIWGIGFLPRAIRSAILLKIRGVDSLRYTHLVSPAGIKRLCRLAGFRLEHIGPIQLNIENIDAYPLQDRILIGCYKFMQGFVLFRYFLLYVGPSFEISCKKISVRTGHDYTSRTVQYEYLSGSINNHSQCSSDRENIMRFGLIGLGGIGQVRKSAIEHAPGCSLTAVFDINKENSAQLASDVRFFNSAEELVASDACDAVIISTPPNFHAEQAISAMEAGKHVIVEKPMSSSMEECRAMLETSRKTGKVLTVGFNHRYFGAIKEMREAIQSQAIGKLSYIRAYTGHTGLSEFKSPWMYDKDVMGGGTLMDNGIHVMDLTQHLMGGVKSVCGLALTDIWKLDRSEDNAFALMRGHGNVVATFHSSWTDWKGYHFYLEAYGDKGMFRAYYAPMMSTLITMDKPGGKRKVNRNFYVTSIFREKFKGWQSTVIQTFVEEISDFIALTKGDAAGGHIARAEDGVRVAEIANAVYKSSSDGGSVELAQKI